MNMSRTDYQDETVFERNRLPSRAYFIPTHNISLNGQWDFLYASSPTEAAALSRDSSAWTTLQVPGHWQLQGHGTPIYTCIKFPFPANPPFVPGQNPTGIYKKEFEIPAWHTEIGESEYWLRFDGVDSAYHVAVNGREVGYNQGARNAAEFDITDMVRLNEPNHVAVTVYQWSDGSYLEAQDHWWLSGIYRDVTLIAVPKLGHIRDFTVRTDLDAEYRDGRIDIQVKCAAITNAQLNIGFYDSQKNEVYQGSCELRLGLSQQDHTFNVSDPAKWTAETPNLYVLRLSICMDGKIYQSIEQQVGFRKIELIDGLISVNGRAVMFRGMNRHDHHPRYGRAVPVDFIRRDLILMKRHNINAIRCAHYPPHPRLFEMANEMGFYVMDEADLECHGFFESVAQSLQLPSSMDYEEKRSIIYPIAAQSTSSNESWNAAYIDRLERMVQRDKNHPCVVIWSLGNESFYGTNHDTMYAWAKEVDPTRLVHYEGDRLARPSDMFSYMYAPVTKLIERAKEKGDKFDKPVILCEYGHSMGNGPGGMSEYWHAFNDHRRLQGGFLWEWANHGLIRPVTGTPGQTFYAYGGDFGDYPNDGAFALSGICNSAHEPGPGLLELKAAMQPVKFEVDGDGILITNLYDFSTLNHLEARWTCSHFQQGTATQNISSGMMNLPSIGPKETARVDLPEKLGDSDLLGEVWLTISLVLKARTTWASSGHEVAWTQILVHESAELEDLSPSILSPPPVVKSNATQFSISGPSFSFVFNKVNARITEWAVGGRDLIFPGDGPRLTFWRAPTDNDKPQDAAMWRRFGLDCLVEDVVSVECTHMPNVSGGSRIVVFSRVAPPALAWGFVIRTQYDLFINGQLHISTRVVPEGPFPESIPRVGFEMNMPSQACIVRWCGKGPGQSYRDSKMGAKIGVYQLTAREMMTDYEVPQENGNRTLTRWVQVVDQSGCGLQAELCHAEAAARASGANRGFDFAVQSYTAQQLTEAKHPHELPEPEALILRLDAAHHGLGSGSCGPKTWGENILRTQDFEFEVRLSAISIVP
ncbi:hypothetical protein HJFPF1_11072 [Paramyrothecium foliicola]|nr:hypothetical protein HJFPF1_11072 [Paramyrothecium foliicola]